MVHITSAMILEPVQGTTPARGKVSSRQHSVLVVRDDDLDNEFLGEVCEFLDIGVTHAQGDDDLSRVLPRLRPMAVVAKVDGVAQDGFHVMKMVAKYDRSLPVLLFTDNEQTLLGAIDAVREIWGLTSVTTATSAAEVGTLVDFVCNAARGVGMTRLMRV